jgi:hypothetical protein
VLDAMNEIAYETTFVVAKNAQKKYIRREEPRVCIRVTSLSKRSASTASSSRAAPIRFYSRFRL